MLRTLAIVLAITMPTSAALAERWFADPQKSRIEFSGEMEDGPVTGTFRRYWVDMQFDPKALENAYINVRIDTTSVDTQKAQRDSVLRQQQWLYTTLFPDARFIAKNITTADGINFLATGTLTLRGVTGPVDFEFTFDRNTEYDFAQLVGTARIKRLDFGVGQGQWLDTSIVGNPVKIVVDLYMRRTLE